MRRHDVENKHTAVHRNAWHQERGGSPVQLNHGLGGFMFALIVTRCFLPLGWLGAALRGSCRPLLAICFPRCGPLLGGSPFELSHHACAKRRQDGGAAAAEYVVGPACMHILL